MDTAVGTQCGDGVNEDCPTWDGTERPWCDGVWRGVGVSARGGWLVTVSIRVGGTGPTPTGPTKAQVDNSKQSKWGGGEAGGTALAAMVQSREKELADPHPGLN